MLCLECRMGFVEEFPRDLSELYGDAYFQVETPTDAEHGYADYERVAAHSTAWAADLVNLMRPSGRALDVGCANGYLLRRLAPSLARHGIEANAAMAERCRAAGIEIVGSDVCDPELAERHRSRFDVITAIAVLEHVRDLAGALRNVRELLAPGGVFLLEVPLVGCPGDTGVWFRSSLEHVYYPTQEGIRNVVARSFGRPPVGGAVEIVDYGWTFVGLVAADERTDSELARLHARVFEAAAATLVEPQEIAFRLSFDLVHAARRGAEQLDLLARVDPAVLSRDHLSRLASLWKTDVERLSELGPLREARNYLQAQRSAWELEAARLARRLEELDQQIEHARELERQRVSRTIVDRLGERVRRWRGRGS